MSGSDEPIFIIGTERSGSNLLRLMLNEHPSISIPHPPHILKELAPLEPLYGDLSSDRRFRRLVNDTVRLVELHFAPWDVPVDAEGVFREAPARDIYAIKAAIYDQYRRAKGKKRWGCKSTFVIHYIDKVRKIHPNAKFIHLVRDGRDVAVSARHSVFNHFHPHYVGRLWSQEQRKAMEAAKNLSAEHFISVRYEDLLDDPAKIVRGVCQFLSEDYSDTLLRYHEGREAQDLAGQSRSWENVARPILKANRAKYRTGLSDREIKAFEIQTFAELQHFGYVPDNELEWLRAESVRGPALSQKLGYWLQENALTVFQGLKSIREDRNALLRFRKRLFLAGLRMSLRTGLR